MFRRLAISSVSCTGLAAVLASTNALRFCSTQKEASKNDEWKKNQDVSGKKEGEELSQQVKRGLPTAGFKAGDVEGAKERATRAGSDNWRGDDAQLSEESKRSIDRSLKDEAKAYAEGGNKAERMPGGEEFSKAMKGDAEDTDANRDKNMKESQSSDSLRDVMDGVKGGTGPKAARGNVEDFVAEDKEEGAPKRDSKLISYNPKGQWKKNAEGIWEKRAVNDTSDDFSEEGQWSSESNVSSSNAGKSTASATKKGATDVTESKDVHGSASMKQKEPEIMGAEVAGLDAMGFPSIGPGPSKLYQAQAEAHLHPKK